MKQQAQFRHSAAKVAFETIMDQGEQWVTWISEIEKFRSFVKDKIRWDGLSKEESAKIQSGLNANAPQSQMLVNSFYITMVAGFEEYLRGVIYELADGISRSKPTFATLNEQLRRANIRETAKLLRRLDSPPDYIKLDEAELCRQLGTCTPKAKSIELNGIALAEIEGLLKLTTFMDRTTLLGKKLNWDYFGNKPLVKSALGMNSDRPRAVANALEEELTVIARYRNRIAHTGGNAADVTMQIIEHHRGILSAVATEIDLA